MCPQTWKNIPKHLTSNEELLPVDPGISFGFLQQTDPVMHLLWCVTVAVDHTVGRNDDKRVGPAMVASDTCE